MTAAMTRAPTVSTVVLRQAVSADARAIAEVHAAATTGAFRAFLPPAVMARYALDKRLVLWQGLLGGKSPPMVMLAVAEEDACQGFIWCRRLPAGEAFDAEVINIHVRPGQQRRGLGRGLMAAGAARLRREGADSCYLWVFAENRPACRFYERLGGRVTERGSECLEGFDVPMVAYAWRPLDALLAPEDG